PGTRMRLNVISAAASGLVASRPILAPTPLRVEGSSFEPWLSGTTTRSRSAWNRVATAHSTSAGLWVSPSSAPTTPCFPSAGPGEGAGLLKTAADDGVEDRVPAVRDRVDLHHVPFGALAVILREFAERPFGLAHARQQAALDHELRVRRHPQVAGQAFDHGQRPPM